MKVQSSKTRCALTRKIIAESSLWSKNSKLKKECWWCVVPGWEKSPTSKICSSYICLKNILGYSFRLEKDSWKITFNKKLEFLFRYCAGRLLVICPNDSSPQSSWWDNQKRKKTRRISPWFAFEKKKQKKNSSPIHHHDVASVEKNFSIIYNTNI